MYKHLLLSLLILHACHNMNGQAAKGHVERLDPALDAIIDSHAAIEIIADSLDWSEGPLWVEKQKMLLFSDVPTNIIYKWTEGKGKEIYLTPSGYTGTIPRGGEKGSNGLILDKQGRLVICMDGDRRVASMEADLSHPKPIFKTLAAVYNGKKFNSPNDMAYNSKGDL